MSVQLCVCVNIFQFANELYIINEMCCLFYASTALFLTDQIPSEGGQHQVHPGGRRSLHQTRQEEPGTAERRKAFPLKL